MDSMDNFRERFEALEQQTAQMRQHTRTIEQRLRWWRGIACGLGLLALHERLNTTVRPSSIIRVKIMDQSALAQLDIIREISDALTRAGIDHWLFGGWAVDFAVGGMTRPHRDVDFVIWEGDLPRLTGLLRLLGYRAQSSKHPKHQLNWEKSGTEVQINLITKTTDGSIISPGTFSDWPWFEGSFGKHRGHIGDLDVPIVSPAGQLESKENFREHPAGQPLRAKDLHDIKQLRTLTRSEQRE